MKIIDKELEIVKNIMVEGFTDPLPDENLKDFVSSGSKFIRSTLCLLYLKSQNVVITNEICKILAVGEIIHNASLLHDDVLDNATLRRGKTTISNKHTPKISILSGDYLTALAVEKLLDIENIEIIRLFKDCIKKMCEAEIQQFFLRTKLPTEDEYIEICRNKTAILFSSVFKSCALLLNIDLRTAEYFGDLYGVCFQIKNDLNKVSAALDKQNGILTAIDVLGIEKTTLLLDNYKEKMFRILEDFSNNIYKEELESLVKEL
ncbi:MAG: hypothetical protein E7Z89_00175 [Cyanobacteria bacterium SIG28]|nr:hypothetical protein [Cyanobacteria bacterium SIG28]